MNPLRRNDIIALGQTTPTPITILFILSIVLVFMSYSSFGRENQSVNGQATITSPGGDVNVLYAGSLLSVMETKLGPAFNHLGYNYKGEGHGSIQDA